MAYWFEYIQLPTDEEIEKEVKKDLRYQHPTVKEHHSVGFEIGFYSGFKEALSILKGEK